MHRLSLNVILSLRLISPYTFSFHLIVTFPRLLTFSMIYPFFFSFSFFLLQSFLEMSTLTYLVAFLPDLSFSLSPLESISTNVYVHRFVFIYKRSGNKKSAPTKLGDENANDWHWVPTCTAGGQLSSFCPGPAAGIEPWSNRMWAVRRDLRHITK